MGKLDLLVAGELNADVVVGEVDWPVPRHEWLAGSGRIVLGSSAGICASNAARLGLRVGLAAVVGRDAFGDAMIEAVRAAGVETRWIRRSPKLATGFSVIINARGVPDKALLTFPGALADLRGSDVGAALSGTRHLHIASYFLLPRFWGAVPGLLRRARRLGISSSLDPNPDPLVRYDSGIRAALAEVDIFLPNEVEACGVAGMRRLEAAIAKLSGGTRAVLVKAGARGAFYCDAHGSMHVPARRLTVVDPTGAGDSFDAGFIAARLQGWDAARALDFGTRCAALACSAAGGTTAFEAAGAVAKLRRRMSDER